MHYTTPRCSSIICTAVLIAFPAKKEMQLSRLTSPSDMSWGAAVCIVSARLSPDRYVTNGDVRRIRAVVVLHTCVRGAGFNFRATST
jgi:hypothetical protein